MTVFNNGTELALPDELNSLIHICDLNGNLINSINPDGLIDQPIGICVLSKDDGTEEIYIGDCSEHKIFVFDSNFTFKRNFGNESLKVPQYILVDGDDEINKYIYASDYSNDEITVWNTENGELVDLIKVEAPFSIRFNAENLFVVSPAEFKLSEGENKVEKIEKGGNCIFVIKKNKPFDVIREIKFEGWLCPSALYISNKLNIYTAAYDLNENGIKSEFKNLFVFDFNGNILNKINLNHVQIIGDMLVLENKLIFSVRNAIRILEFEENYELPLNDV
jgi:hypothetical protein